MGKKNWEGTYTLRRNGSSVVVVVLLITAIFSIFLVQIPLQKEKTIAAPAKGADVAVIGGTTAALMSALKAAKNGAQVYLFPNGQDLAEDISFLVTGGLALAKTPVQEEAGIEFGPELFAELLKEQGSGLNDPLLVQAFISTDDIYEELVDTSGLFFDMLPRPDSSPYFHLTTEHNPDLLFKQKLLNEINRTAVLLSNERVKELLFSSQGRVEALLLENDRGKSYPFYTQAVILADGGHRSDAIQRYLPAFSGNLVSLKSAPKNESLKIAADLGLDMIQKDFFDMKVLLHAPLKENYRYLPPDSWERTYIVNTEGQILPLSEISAKETLNFILSSPTDGAYLIAPENQAERYGDCFRIFEQLERFLQACSLEELPQFDRRWLPGPPYCVASLKAGMDYMLGGISVTPRGEVKKNGKIVKGLYASGEIVGGLHGEALLPGMALSETVFLAKTSGSSAAGYAQR